MSVREFTRLYRRGSCIPIKVDIDCDTETPVSAYLKLSRGAEHAFLFESVEGGERFGRWSFLGAHPRRVLNTQSGEEALQWVAETLETYQATQFPDFPRFTGGLVGYFGYDVVSAFEPSVLLRGPQEYDFDGSVLMDFDTVVAFDNLRHIGSVITQARYEPDADAAQVYSKACARLEQVRNTLALPLSDVRGNPVLRPAQLKPRTTRPDFEAAVSRAREYICAGECQQIVVSQRFDAEVDVAPFEVYRALRRINPSPYLFFVQCGTRALAGSSPETLVRLDRGDVILRPIAGTRPRGATPELDADLAEELLADVKENAEHVMLVDLGRNDVGRVAEIGSVRLEAYRVIEKYSHVQHMVSQVRGRLAPGLGALDVLRATFPAGTVTGSPKVRAMQLIDELEPSRRGPYAGCVGYFDLSGDMEMAIAIRTLFQSGNRLSVQAGAGVVYDSVPEAEYLETLAKARAVFAAVEEAQRRTLAPRAETKPEPTAVTPPAEKSPELQIVKKAALRIVKSVKPAARAVKKPALRVVKRVKPAPRKRMKPALKIVKKAAPRVVKKAPRTVKKTTPRTVQKAASRVAKKRTAVARVATRAAKRRGARR